MSTLNQKSIIMSFRDFRGTRAGFIFTCLHSKEFADCAVEPGISGGLRGHAGLCTCDTQLSPLSKCCTNVFKTDGMCWTLEHVHDVLTESLSLQVF